MAPRNTDNTPAPDVYVSLLFVSLAALITGIVMLVLELGKYSWKMAPEHLFPSAATAFDSVR